MLDFHLVTFQGHFAIRVRMADDQVADQAYDEAPKKHLKTARGQRGGGNWES